MNRKMVFRTVGLMLEVESALMLLPLAVALLYHESCIEPILSAAMICFLAGFALVTLCKPQDQLIYAREGFAIVAISWIAVSLAGALPFTFSGEIPSYVDAVFETVSGFTTTGSSILTDVESMSRGLLFWRSFTHWVGGMGVLVFVMALMPNFSDRSIHIMRAEMPGPVVGKLLPRAKDTAAVLYKIYIGMTIAEIGLLLLGGMPLFDSIVHAFGTAGTGGFGIKADSIASYSPYLQYVITIFMLLFGVNFNLYYLLLIRRFRAAGQCSEVWYYLGIVGTSIALITSNILPLCESFGEALRLSAFQVSSIITTTGYATADFNLWPQLSKTILLMLMMVGACAGSTGGGLKVSRAVMLIKMAGRELKHLLHPRSVNTVSFEGKNVDGATLKSVSSYFALYMLCILAVYFILSFEGYDMETNLGAAVACFNNIGPGFALCGPAANYAFYSPLSKIVLSIAMLLGRLEIFPLLLTVVPSTWMDRR